MARRRVKVEKIGKMPRIKPGDTVPRTGTYYVQGGTRIKPLTEKRGLTKSRYKRKRKNARS